MNNLDWSIWNPVIAGHGTLIEVQTLWSIDDVMDSIEAIEIKAEMEHAAEAEAAKRRGGAND